MTVNRKASNVCQPPKDRNMQTEDKTMSAAKCRDSGLALVLICLLCFQVWKQPFLIPAAICVLLAAMIYPPIFKPFAKLWYALSMMLGLVISRIVLTLIFFLVVFPVALLRKLMGKDSLQIKRWKKGNDSVFRRRDHQYGLKDLEHPY